MNRHDDLATLTIPAAAKMAGVSIRVINAAIEAGQIVAVRVGKRWRIPVKPFEDYLSGRTGSRNRRKRSGS